MVQIRQLCSGNGAGLPALVRPNQPLRCGYLDAAVRASGRQHRRAHHRLVDFDHHFLDEFDQYGIAGRTLTSTALLAAFACPIGRDRDRENLSRPVFTQSGSEITYLRLIDIVSLNSRLESNKEEEKKV